MFPEASPDEVHTDMDMSSAPHDEAVSINDVNVEDDDQTPRQLLVPPVEILVKEVMIECPGEKQYSHFIKCICHCL